MRGGNKGEEKKGDEDKVGVICTVVAAAGPVPADRELMEGEDARDMLL